MFLFECELKLTTIVLQPKLGNLEFLSSIHNNHKANLGTIKPWNQQCLSFESLSTSNLSSEGGLTKQKKTKNTLMLKSMTHFVGMESINMKYEVRVLLKKSISIKYIEYIILILQLAALFIASLGPS